LISEQTGELHQFLVTFLRASGPQLLVGLLFACLLVVGRLWGHLLDEPVEQEEEASSVCGELEMGEKLGKNMGRKKWAKGARLCVIDHLCGLLFGATQEEKDEAEAAVCGCSNTIPMGWPNVVAD